MTNFMKDKMWLRLLSIALNASDRFLSASLTKPSNSPECMEQTFSKNNNIHSMSQFMKRQLISVKSSLIAETCVKMTSWMILHTLTNTTKTKPQNRFISKTRSPFE